MHTTWQLSPLFTAVYRMYPRCTLDAVHMPVITTLPEFVQLLDDDIVSLTALMLIVNAECSEVDGQ